MLSIDRESIIWAAGLFEGEGCFTITQNSSCKTPRMRPSATVTSTDKDVVEAFHLAVGGIGRVNPRKPGKVGEKPQWAWSVSGFEAVQAVTAMLYPWLKSRRRSRAEEVLLQTVFRLPCNAMRHRTCSINGCQRPAHAKEMCTTHHSSFRERERRKASGYVPRQVAKPTKDQVADWIAKHSQNGTPHCPQGHPYAGDNLQFNIRKNGRLDHYCRTCRYAQNKRWRDSRRAACSGQTQ